VFFISEITIGNWLKRLDEPGCGLVALREPVNRFPEYVRQVVQQLKCVCPTMGKVRIAQLLARAGLQLSPSTVRRFLRQSMGPKRGPTEGPSTRPNGKLDDQSASAGTSKAGRAIVAKRPHHVWHIDLTVVPTHVGFWVPWFPFSGLLCWPFGYRVVVVVDHFTRKAVAVEVFENWPSSDDITSWLDVIMASIEQRPKYIISDQGVQFGEAYGDWCAARGIKPRFGAIGEHGSIAVVERFILSLKNECTRRIVVSLRIDDFREELFAYCRWYNQIRPHQSRGGRTPSEVAGEVIATVVPRFEPRLRLLKSNQRCRKLDSNVVPVVDLRLNVDRFEGRTHLPVVRLDRAA
jgi:putative transposase